jgi:BMFP domain-containing protein YqiC
MIAITIFITGSPVGGAQHTVARERLDCAAGVSRLRRAGDADGDAAATGPRWHPATIRTSCMERIAALPSTDPAPTVRAQMIDLDKLDDLARRLSSLVPPAMRAGREELQQNFKSVLQAGLGKLDLVTREEFEVQRAVLLRTREKLEALETLLATLEAQLGAAAANDAPPQH